MISDASLHCGCDSQRLMDSTEVVVSKLESISVPEVSHFFEKAFVSLVIRRIAIRTVRFERSICDVQTRSILGLPWTFTLSVPIHFAGEYRFSPGLL